MYHLRLHLLVWVKARVGMVRPLASPFCIYAIPVSFADAVSRSFQGPGRKGKDVPLFFVFLDVFFRLRSLFCFL